MLCGLAFTAQAASGTQIIREGEHKSSALYTEVASDMTVQTGSGSLTAYRYFHDGAWEFFSGWGALDFSASKGADGNPANLSYHESSYLRESGGSVIYRFDEQNVVYKKDANTWRWQHTNGDWVDFNLSGRSIASGHRQLTYFTITHNASGDITQIDDRRGQLVQ